MDHVLEREIIQRVLRGEQDAYAELVDRYKGPVFKLVYSMTRNYTDADDIAQETFVRAFTSLKRFDDSRPFFPWLYTIALNLTRNHLKKKKRFPLSLFDRTQDENTQKDAENPEDTLIRLEAESLLLDALDELALPVREAVVLRFFQELPFDVIGEILGVSVSAAKMRVYRGLKRLKEILGE